MATKDLKNEYAFEGMTLNGFLMLFVTLALIFGSIAMGIWAGIEAVTAAVVLAVILFITGLIFCGGFLLLEPNEARVLLFFGKYKGTFTRTGYFWVHPFLTAKKLSLRARNLDAEPIKVNDKTGNPVINSITASTTAAGTASIPPHIAIAIEPNNNTNVTNSIKKPFNVVPSKAYSFFNSFVAIILYFYKMFF